MGQRAEFVGWWLLGLVLLVVTIGVLMAFSLGTMPWVVQQQREIVRQSNSYVTTQQAALREFKGDYEALSVKVPVVHGDIREALEAQQAGIVRQMKQIAQTIPDNVPGDIREFLATH